MKKEECSILANGCFWCTEAVFQRIKGVQLVQSGYTGGSIKNPAYREICTGRTGHAEGVKILFDPNIVSYKTLLYVFFSTHDPTTLNRQGNDVGTQYRSAIFYTSEEQKDIAQNIMGELQASTFQQPIVTELKAEMPFYLAEEEHHNYYNQNKQQPYCQSIIDPKVALLKEKYNHLIKQL